MNTFVNKTPSFSVFILAYIIGGLLAIFISHLYHFNREFIGLIFFLGAILSFLIKFDISLLYETEEKTNFSKSTNSLFILWTFFLISSIILSIKARQNYYLPLFYFLLILCQVFIVNLQIFGSKPLSKVEIYLILFEIMASSTIVFWSVLYLFPGFYGNDSTYHIEYIMHILSSGNIEYSGHYLINPLFHIMYVVIALISDIDPKTCVFFLGLIQVIFTLFVYLLSSKIFNNRIALISTLLVSLSTNLMVSKYSLFPSTYSVIFFYFVLYLFFNSMYKNLATIKIIFLILFVSLVFTHPLSPLIVIFTLAILLIICKISKLKNIILNFSSILLALVLTLTNWMRNWRENDSLFLYAVQSINNMITNYESIENSVTQATLSSSYSFKDIIIYDMGLMMLFFLGILGSFLIIRVSYVTNNTIKHRNVISFVTLIFIPIPYVLALIYPQSLPARWFPYIEVLTGILAGVAVYAIFRMCYLSKLKFLPHLLVVTVIFFSITSPISNPNSHLYSENLSHRNSLTQSEINAAYFTNKYIDITKVHANSQFLQYINRSVCDYDHLVDPSLSKSYENGIILVRNYDIEKGFTIPLFGSKNLLLDIILPSEEFYVTMSDNNKIFENNQVRIYSTKGGLK